MKILADASLPGLIEAFPPPFELDTYHDLDELKLKLAGKDILLCRSTLKVNESLLAGTGVRYVATASSGIDHIDQACLKAQGIELISAKGSNAVAVADYVLACLAWLQKHQAFEGKTAAVIGVGEVGSRVSEQLKARGFEVLHYDPPKAQREQAFKSCDLEAIRQCDLICIHAELHDEQSHPSRNLFNEKVLSSLKDKTVIINASRGGIVNEKALLDSKKSFVYCVDVYYDEPAINPAIVDYATLCTPHIAGHSLEAKYEAVNQISRYFHQTLGLNYPEFAYPELTDQQAAPSYPTWQDLILSHYDPSIETKALKQASDLKAEFLTLRKAHQKRHNFDVFFSFRN